jgi:hypothetical protein
MVNFGYHLARARGQAVRKLYARQPRWHRQPQGRSANGAPVRDLLVFRRRRTAGASRVDPLAASPRRAASEVHRRLDGTHTTRSTDLLQRVDQCVAISSAADWVPPEATGKLRDYLSAHPTGKQLALIMSLPVGGPTLYIDSDVLFFQGAAVLAALKSDNTAPARYLADCQVSADERLFRDPAEREIQ